MALAILPVLRWSVVGADLAVIVLLVCVMRMHVRNGRRLDRMEAIVAGSNRELKTAQDRIAALTWPCDFCGESRPDELIGVTSRTRQLGVVEAKFNARYCVDRPDCVAAAKAWEPHMTLLSADEAPTVVGSRDILDQGWPGFPA